MKQSFEEECIAEVGDEIRRLIKLARDDAEDALWKDPKRMAEIAFGDDGMYLCMPGVDGQNESGALPLVVELRDMTSNSPKPHLTFDPIKALIDAYGGLGEDTQEAIARAISTLEAAIVRLRAEAEREAKPFAPK